MREGNKEMSRKRFRKRRRKGTKGREVERQEEEVEINSSPCCYLMILKGVILGVMCALGGDRLGDSEWYHLGLQVNSET